MTYEFIDVRHTGNTTTISLSRPEVLNALHAPAQFELDRAIDEFAADPDRWVAILTGAGDRAFCAGGDLKALATDGGKGRPRNGFGGITSRFDLEKPIIAAVNGVAYGGGFEAALACDVIIAAENATFALPEPRRGLAALGGGVHRLARDIGPKRALSMILRANAVSAEEGYRLGFVSEVVRNEDLMPTALRWAQDICQLSPLAIRASKDLVYRGLAADSLEMAMKQQSNYPAVRALLDSEDFLEGPRAYAEGRPPKWTGR